jgi:hypothetical protein
MIPRTQLPHLPRDGGNKDLWDVGKLLPDYMALQPRRQPSSYSPPWEPQILLSELSYYHWLGYRWDLSLLCSHKSVILLLKMKYGATQRMFIVETFIRKKFSKNFLCKLSRQIHAIFLKPYMGTWSVVTFWFDSGFAVQVLLDLCDSCVPKKIAGAEIA